MEYVEICMTGLKVISKNAHSMLSFKTLNQIPNQLFMVYPRDQLLDQFCLLLILMTFLKLLKNCFLFYMQMIPVFSLRDMSMIN